MARSCTPRPAVPSTAERARSVAVRAGGAALITGPAGPGTTGDEALERVTPTLHHVPATGAATLQLPDDHPMVAHAGPISCR